MVIASKRLTRTRPSTCSKKVYVCVCVCVRGSEWSEGLLRTCLEYDYYYGEVVETKFRFFSLPLRLLLLPRIWHYVATRNDDNDDSDWANFIVLLLFSPLLLFWLFVWFHQLFPAASFILLFELSKSKADIVAFLFCCYSRELYVVFGVLSSISHSMQVNRE